MISKRPTDNEQQQSLDAARRASAFLRLYIESQIVDDNLRADIACLLEEFNRLDANARRPNAGRKRIETDNPKTLAQRRWRDKHK